MHLTASPVKQLAVQHGLPVLQPTTLKTEEAQQAIAQLDRDIQRERPRDLDRECLTCRNDLQGWEECDARLLGDRRPRVGQWPQGDPGSRMSLLLFRVDDRLIHGQVVIGWGRPLGIDFIVLVDDAVRASAWEQDLYRMGVPPEIEVIFASREEAARDFAQWSASSRRGPGSRATRRRSRPP